MNLRIPFCNTVEYTTSKEAAMTLFLPKLKENTNNLKDLCSPNSLEVLNE
ncbi:hypothetical protein K2F_25550 [Enterococcus thailandicus]|nr:hypothetical protein K2F_25550 [Enterococcus thailandicus]